MGHENKCRLLHGHNYRATFEVQGELDAIGRVLDFGIIKELLCEWLEMNWDHKMILWDEDPILAELKFGSTYLAESIVQVPFNPTAENMARYLVEEIGPTMLPSHLQLVQVVLEETRKCSASYTLANNSKPHPLDGI